MLKFIPYLSAISANNLGQVENIGNGLYEIRNNGGIPGSSAVLFGVKTYPDGNSGIETPSMDMIYDEFYLVKLCLLTVYVLLAVTAVYLMRIKHKLKKHGKQTAFYGSSVMTAGHIARLVSVLALLGAYAVYANCQGGIPIIAGTVLGIVQMLCIAICGISAVTSCIAASTHKKGKMLTVRYILNAICCVLPILAILYFEMYRFWGC